jgi:hypothetical protein
MEYLEQPNYHHFQQQHHLLHDPIPQAMPHPHYADAQQNMRDYAAAMAHRQPPPPPMLGLPHSSAKTNETKPRLGKDEVDILEREFKKNPKPSTQTKRQFAEHMRVDLARINVRSKIPPSLDRNTDFCTELVPEPSGQEKAGIETRSL